MPTFLGNPRSPIGAVSRSADKLDIFAVADDGNVYTAAWEPDFGSWHGWYLIGGATFPPGAPVYAVSRSAEKLDIFAVNDDFGAIVPSIVGTIMTSAWEPGFTQWSIWRQVANGAASPGAHVTAVSRSTDKLDIFVSTHGRAFPEQSGYCILRHGSPANAIGAAGGPSEI